ncbi:hypothetical protein [Amycolatopsis minnesotensis]|uniref:Uncharacterized protein n=1 Tax=Amycolatopsis minnesotensis TaxID=337894 RepID=A0ABN2SAV0_9PSEU
MLPENTAEPATTIAEPVASVRHLHAVSVDEDHTGAAAPAPEAALELGDEPRFVAALKAVFTPDSGLWQDRQPSIAENWRTARRGAQCPETGPARVLSIGAGYLQFVIHAVCDAVKWSTASRAKLAVTALLVAGLFIWFG